MRFFPIVPYNVPRDDFAKYLQMYDSAAEALLASRDANVHAEWDINARAPVMRELHGLGYTSAWTARPTGDHLVRRGAPRNDLARTLVSHMRLEAYHPDALDPWTLGIIGQPIGPDETRLTNMQAGLEFVSPTWAQRAANAFLATVGASPIAVDGVVGMQTITALRFAMLRYYAAASHTAVEPDTGQIDINGIPMPARSGASVALPTELANYLATLTQVADPPRVARPLPVPAPETPVPQPPPYQAPPSIPGAASGGGLLVLVALGAGAWYLSKRR